MMTQFALKLVLTPVLIVVISIVARRWGPKTGGLLAGLPLTSAPISVFLAIEQGRDFAARAAAGTLSGVGAVAAFCLAYAFGSKRWSWLICSVVATFVFVIFAAALRLLPTGPLCNVLLTFSILGGVLAFFPQTEMQSATRHRPAWDLPFRAVLATGLVLILTAAASKLGARLTGLLSPLPVFANVLAAFAQVHDGSTASILLLRGIVLASFSFALFFFVVASGLPRWGIFPVFVFAAAVALAVNWFTYSLEARNHSELKANTI